MSSLKTEQWQVRICTAHMRVEEKLKSSFKVTHTLPSVSKSSPFSLVIQSQASLASAIISAWEFIMHNEQLYILVKVPSSHCFTQSYNGWGKKQRIVVNERGYIS